MIIAVDFDGILCENEFPEIGKPNYEVIAVVQELIDKGHEVILWTSRTDNELASAVKWCEYYGLHFCAINENAPSNIKKYIDKYPNGTRKIFADVYIDDHNLEYWSERHRRAQQIMISYLKNLKGVGVWKNVEED